MVTCPRGLAVGTCCAIQKTGAVFVQEMNACRAAVAKGGEMVLSRRVAFSKAGGPIVLVKEEEGAVKKAATDAQAINIRKVAWDLIQQTAANLRRERAGLTKAEAIVETAKRYPRLAELYDQGVRRGDAPEELMPPAPVAKASGRTKADVSADIEARATALVAKRGAGLTQAQAIVEVVTKAPALYDEYVNARP